MASGATQVDVTASAKSKLQKERATSKGEDEDWVAFQVQSEIVDFNAEEENPWLGATGIMGAALLAVGACSRIIVFFKAI